MKKKFFAKSFLALPLLALTSMASCSFLKEAESDFKENEQEDVKVDTAQTASQPISIDVGSKPNQEEGNDGEEGKELEPESESIPEPKPNPEPVERPDPEPTPDPEPEPDLNPELTNTITVKWLNSDGTLLEEDEIDQGMVPHYDGSTPKRENTTPANDYDFFVGWDKELGKVYEDTSFVAQFETKEFTEDIINFKLSTDGTFYVASKIDDSIRGEIVIPSIHEGLPVKNISSNGFHPNISLPSEEQLAATKVYIQDGIELIGYNAFSEISTLESVYIPSSVKRIGSSAFGNCPNLVDVVINDGVEYIESFAFEGAQKVKNFAFPNTVKEIGEGAFKFFAHENGFHVTDGCAVESAGKNAFQQSGMLSGYFPNLVNIDEAAFTNCNILENLKLSYNLETIPVNCFNECMVLKDFNIPSGVTSIGRAAFAANYALEEIVIPEGVTTISHGLFDDCRNLKKVTCLGNITQIDGYAFSRSGLEELIIPNLNAISTLDIGLFNGTNYSSFEILSKFDTVYEYMYNGNTNFVNLTIPDNIKKIKSYAFGNCTNLESVDLNNVEEIGAKAFTGDSKLTAINFPETVKVIGAYAFENCSLIENVTFPSELTTIGNQVFSGTKIKDIVIPGTITSLGAVCNGLTTLQTATIDEGITSLPTNIFNACSNLEVVNLPLSLTTINVNAFSACPKLKTINFAGTKAQWDNINKMETTGLYPTKWNGYGANVATTGFKVICSDGQEVQY